jgi:hypothetical protein
MIVVHNTPKYSDMERFKLYGELEKITSGEGILQLGNEIEYNVSFEIAKRGEEKLLFSAICEAIDQFDSINLFQRSGKIRLAGKDDLGRNVNAIDLLIKDSETNAEGENVINGYVGKCEIGEKTFSDNFTAQFDLINFVFLGNETSVEKTEKGKKYSRSILQLDFSDFHCRIEQDKDYSIIKQLLKRQGGVLKTSTLSTSISCQSDYEIAIEKVKKLCQLLSVARSTFINWGSCRVLSNSGDVVYELHGSAQTKPFHGNNLIKDLPKETESFLKSAWIAFEENKEVFDLSRFLYGYADTYMNSYIETRCLNIAALIDSLSSRWAIKENRDRFINKIEYEKKLPRLKMEIIDILQKAIDGLKESYVQVMLSKTEGLNRRPLDWKLKRLRKSFHCPITDDEIKRFVYNRDSLAHSSLFPDDEDNKQTFLFMRHFLDRIVLRVLGYSGNYFDMENREEKSLIDN